MKEAAKWNLGLLDYSRRTHIFSAAVVLVLSHRFAVNGGSAQACGASMLRSTVYVVQSVTDKEAATGAVSGVHIASGNSGLFFIVASTCTACAYVCDAHVKKRRPRMRENTGSGEYTF